MSKDNTEEETKVDSENVEVTTSSEDNSETDSGSNTDQEKGKKFDIWKEYKKLKKDNKVLKAMKAIDEEEDNEEYSESESKPVTKWNFDVEYEIFMLKNPEAADYSTEIKDAITKFPWISLEDAMDFSKVHHTKSVSKKDFSTKSANPKKDLEKYSKEEILATKDKKKLLEWSRLQKRVS